MNSSHAQRVRTRKVLGFVSGTLLSTFAGIPGTVFAESAPTTARPMVGLQQGSAAERWVAATPSEMLVLSEKRALRGQGDALAALAVMGELAPRADAGSALESLKRVAASSSKVAGDALWMAHMLEVGNRPDPSLLHNIAILGPFQDSGGGLTRKEGAELPGQRWNDPKAAYDWGANEVRWRKVPESAVSARGVPLSLLVYPRKETCSYLATPIGLRSPTTLLATVATTGAMRMIWDGADIAVDEDVHPKMSFDRRAVRIEAGAGNHLLAVKVCSGAIDDEGRTRLRIEGVGGALPLTVTEPSWIWSGVAAPSRHTEQGTSLQRALDSSREPTVSEALAEAIVRTLGGTDDLRSPRAPGLLDKVATAPKAGADALAMAGWVSPFGASRSNWLNLARDRALKEGDGGIADFAERRLAVSRLSGRLFEWAMASLDAPPFAQANDPEARLIRASIRAEAGLDSLRRLSLNELRLLTQEQGAHTSAAVWETIARHAENMDPALFAQAESQLASLLPEKMGLAYVRSRAFEGESALRLAARESVTSGSLSSADELFGLAEELLQGGLTSEATEVFEQARMLAPNRAAGYRGASHAQFAKGDRERATANLVRGRDLAPGDPAYRAELALRRDTLGSTSSSGPGAPSDREKDEKYLAEPATFLARKAAHPLQQGEVFERQLHWLRAVTFHADRRVSQLIHYSREIVIEPRSQEELFEQIPAEGDEAEILRARVHRAAGGVALAEEQKSEGGRATIRWPDLKTGDVVEVAVRFWTSGPVGRRGDPPFYFIDYAGSVQTRPLLYNEVIVDSATDQPLYVDVLHGKADRQTETVAGGRKILRMIWDAPVAVRDEPLAPKPSETLPTIIGSTFANWKDFRAWYQAAVSGFTTPDDQVRRLAAELTRGKTTREEKVRAIFEFVADDIRYVNYVSGEWWLPNRPQQLLARRQGDCDDKAILLITLLKAAGIEATEVLIQTRYTGQSSVLLSKKAAIPLFDHGIAYLPDGSGKGTWLDATSPQSRLGPVPSMDARTFALFATEGPPEMVATPQSSPEEHGVEGTWRVDVRADGGAELLADERHLGDQAFLLRTALGEKDARAQWVEQNLVASWFPSVQVASDVDFSSDLPHGAARVRYRAHSDGLARHEGADLVLPLSAASTYTSELAPLLTRTLPVVLPPYLAPSRQTRTVRVVAPRGYRFADLPPGGRELGGEFGAAELEIRRAPEDARVALVRRSISFGASTIPVASYGAWRSWLQRVDALMHRSLRLTPEVSRGH